MKTLDKNTRYLSYITYLTVYENIGSILKERMGIQNEAPSQDFIAQTECNWKHMRSFY